MSFEYIVEKDSKTKKLSDVEAAELAQQVGADFDTYNSQRRSNLDKADKLSREIFFKDTPKKYDEKEVGSFADSKKNKHDRWKTKVKMCKTYMFYCVLKAFIWKNIYANVNSMFDVSGENQEADNDSNKQKSALVDVFEKMEFAKICDKIIDYALLYGELISFASWKKISQEYRKKITPMDLVTNPAAIKESVKGKFYFIDEKVIYNNPYVYAVNPANLTFDVTQKENFDDCPKIYKTYKTADEIINNKYYTVSKEVARELRAMTGKTADGDSQMDKDKEHKVTNGSTIEVLEHWGNLTLSDGTVLKNWHVVVAGRKHLVRFAKNNRIINPFTFQPLVEDPETGRGISPLYCVLSLAEMQEDLMNRTCDMQALAENPPIYAPKGFFKDEEIKLYPGKIIEFGDELSPQKIQQMEFSVGVFLNDITFISDLMAEVSGIFPNMAGADESRAKTATEISTKAQGQLTRLSLLIDCINQGLIVPIVKKVAKLCADFKSGDEQILVTNGNKKDTITINDRIRQAEYRYTYADRTATTDRNNKADIIASAFERFAKFIRLNGDECFTWYMEQHDVENPERFLEQSPQMPAEVQELLMQDPRVQQLCAQVEEQKAQNSNAPDKAPVVIPDASIPEAQPME